MKIKKALRSYGVIGTMLLCMIGFLLLRIGHRDIAFSEKENRVLQQRPALDMAAVCNGSFQKESEEWLRDQFDQRFALVQLHANLSYALGKRKLQDVIIGHNGILFQEQENPDHEQLQKKAQQLQAFAKRHTDKKLSMLLVPNKSAIWREQLPMYEQGGNQLDTLKDFQKEL